jgi:hypothetical protein
MTIQKLSSKFEVHSNQISTWKSEFLTNASVVFESGKSSSKTDVDNERLYKVIGQQKVQSKNIGLEYFQYNDYKMVELLQDTIKTHGKPQIHNSDQGSQYTSELNIKTLPKNEIKISMDGKGGELDNIYIERFWRYLKQETIYLNPPNGVLDLFEKVKDYVPFY